MRRREVLFGTAAALAGCALPRRGPPDHSLSARLRRLVVASNDFYRGDLYTWTTVKGIEQLRATRKLLTATATTGGFVSPFISALARHRRSRIAGAALADTLLTHPALLRRRYAWPSPFATVMGIGDRTYGNSLVRIELRPEAWLARFEPTEPFELVDAGGAMIPIESALREPERIGAVYHVRFDAPVPFREYVVVSEAMVAAWSIATPQIRDKLAAEIALLRDVHDAAFPPSATERAASENWARTPTEPARLWQATLAFDNDRYRARPAQLDKIIETLGHYDPAGPPLVVARQAVAYSSRSALHSSSSAT